jgi:PAS domain S-box-containing protein
LPVDADRRSPITVLPFPSDDLVFAARVRQILRETSDDSADDAIERLCSRLRPVHPHVAASIRAELAGFGRSPVVYVFRDGTTRRSLDDRWIDDAATARVVSDPAGAYLEANDEAAALFGVSKGQIVGSRAGSFTRPDSRIEDADTLWQALARKGRLHSFAVIRRPDGNETSVEFVTIANGDGPGRNVTVLREVADRAARSPCRATRDDRRKR